MPIFNAPNLAAIIQAISDSQTAIVNNSDSNAAAVVSHVSDETAAAEVALAAEIAAKATATQTAVDNAATATQAAVAAKGVIKSVQRGSVLMTAATENVTIAAVVMAKSLVTINATGSGSSAGRILGGGKLTSTTNIQLSVGEYVSSICTVNWEVVEYE